jgi:zinc transport system substrate-binding protein
VYQYFTRRYNLNARSVHWEPDQIPDQTMWDELERLLGEHPAKWMIWEGEPLETVVTRLAELGVDSVVFDPCGGAPDEGDYLSVMEANVENLSRACAAQR